MDPKSAPVFVEQFGFRENESQTQYYFRLSHKAYADLLVRADIARTPYNDSAATPSGASLEIVDGRRALLLVEDRALQFRRVYGYIGEIKLPPAFFSQDHIIPLQILCG